ncbi:hypothetical protein GCM10009603_30150 [Nocardiopsis exhalans]
MTRAAQTATIKRRETGEPPAPTREQAPRVLGNFPKAHCWPVRRPQVGPDAWRAVQNTADEAGLSAARVMETLLRF